MTPLIPALLAVGCFALAVRGVMMIRERGSLARFELAGDLETEVEQPGRPLARIFRGLGSDLGRRIYRALGEQRRERVAARIDQAGRPGGITVEWYATRKAELTLAGGALGLLMLLAGVPLLFPLLIICGWIAVDVWLSRIARLRQEELERNLPDFLDILAVTVRAGLGYRAALARVAAALGGVVGEEIDISLRQMDLGATRREAFEGLRDRNDSESLDQFVTAQLQAEELGVPLAEAITDLATDMRRSTYQAARRRAQRAAPRVSLIVTTFIVPGAVLLIFAALISGSGISGSDLR
jgi:tight adherence protein C